MMVLVVRYKLSCLVPEKLVLDFDHVAQAGIAGMDGGTVPPCEGVRFGQLTGTMRSGAVLLHPSACRRISPAQHGGSDLFQDLAAHHGRLVLMIADGVVLHNVSAHDGHA